MMTYVEDVVAVLKNVVVMQSLMKMVKQSSIRISVKGCGRCIGACVFDAIENQNWNANEILGRKMAEYSQAVCDGRPTFHISLVRDISPNCDCHRENDAPILPDVEYLCVI